MAIRDVKQLRKPYLNKQFYHLYHRVLSAVASHCAQGYQRLKRPRMPHVVETFVNAPVAVARGTDSPTCSPALPRVPPSIERISLVMHVLYHWVAAHGLSGLDMWLAANPVRHSHWRLKSEPGALINRVLLLLQFTLPGRMKAGTRRSTQ